MSLYGQKQLADGMRTVRKNTITIAEDIPEAQYDFRPTPESRSVRETLLHIASKMLFDIQIHEEEKRGSLEGFDFNSFFSSLPTYEKLPLSKPEILTLLSEGSERWSTWVENLPEERLMEIVTRGGSGPGGESRFEMLIGTKEHEMHHRAKLMVTERLLGIVPHLTRNRQQRPAPAEKSTREIFAQALKCFADPQSRREYFDFYSHDIIVHGYQGIEPGLDNVKHFYYAFWKVFPDAKVIAQDLIGEGDTLVARYTITGTMHESFMGVAATGQRIEVPGISILHFRNGQCFERWTCSDSSILFNQIKTAVAGTMQ